MEEEALMQVGLGTAHPAAHLKSENPRKRQKWEKEMRGSNQQGVKIFSTDQITDLTSLRIFS